MIKTDFVYMMSFEVRGCDFSLYTRSSIKRVHSYLCPSNIILDSSNCSLYEVTSSVALSLINSTIKS